MQNTTAGAGSRPTKIRPPTDKEKLHLSEVQVGPSGHTPLFFTKGEPRRGGCWTWS